MIVETVPADCSRAPVGNPFATRHTRPGRLAPLDGHGHPRDVAALLERLAALGGRAAIRGPHGSGKTTLLEHLAEGLQHRGAAVERVRLRAWRDGAAAAVADVAAAIRAILRCRAGGTVCIDSWEQLGWTGRLAVRCAAAWRRSGLLVTSHRVTELPTLIDCHTSRVLLERLVERLPGAGGMSPSEIDDAFARHGGNLRDSLADLYDRFEACRR